MTKDGSDQITPAVQFRTVDEDYAGQRLDNYLLRELKGVPKTRIYRALRKGEVRVNKGRVKADYRLKSGDIVRVPPIRVPLPSETPSIPNYWAKQLEEGVLYEDDGLLVLNKPSGLAVHGGSGLNFGMIECLRQMRPNDRYLELVHRLDRDTSGCILVARKPAILRELHRQLREKKMDKRYLGLVRGSWPKSCRLVDAPLEKNIVQSGERMVRVSQEGKRSTTGFSVVEKLSGATLIEAQPITGRTHQIRVHTKHAGFPLLGDAKYSDDKGGAFAREIGLKRLFLHAHSLSFSLPDRERIQVHAPIDKDLEYTLKRLRKPLK
ncbi:MAG: 23S rRNA pseudouridine955/2504/2580 synthase [Halioglobus sp.]|jgi:23S rRNA pseudouridine955/2504/2580 synthase